MSRPQIHFVVAVPPAGSQPHSLSNLADNAMHELREYTGSAREVYRGPMLLRDLSGLLIHSEAEQAGQKFHYEHRLIATNGWAYRLIAWGPYPERMKVAEAAAYLAWRFELIDSWRRPDSTNSTRP